MKTHVNLLLLSVTMFAATVTPLRAQLVADGATNTLANVTNNITGTLTVGTNGSFTLLVLSNNVLVTNSVNGVIGANATAKSNEVRLVSPTARWQMGGSLIVGHNGAFNRLLVSNGATVLSAGSSILGNDAFAGSPNSNTVTVSGAGSSWINGLDLIVGELGFANRLEVNNGGWVVSSNGFVGRSFFSPSNTVVVTGSGSVWSNRADLSVGGTGAGNLLVVSNGGWVVNSNAYLGNGLGVGNVALVTGLNSTWSNRADLFVGNRARGNQLVVSDGARVVANNGVLGSSATSSNNLALITGAGSIWSNRLGLIVGHGGSANQLVMSNGATVAAGNLFVGFQSSSLDNRLLVDGGTLRVTNITGNGTFEVRRGTNVLNAGLLEADVLLVTNTLGRFELNGGTAAVRSSRITSGHGLRVGNGVSPATFILAGNGSHFFDTVIVFANGTLTGNGTIGLPSANASVVLDGGTLSPGASIGKMVFTNNLLLFGTVLMEISKNGAVVTNDQVQATGGLTYGGELVVTNLGPTGLTSGDKFQLFNAGFSGSFAPLTLPPLAPGLSWTNKLSMDGSIQVVGVPLPVFADIMVSGTNLVFSGNNGPPNAPYAILTATNVTLPVNNWVSLATNLFGPVGEFSFTNGIAPGEPQRFFRLRTP